MRLKHTVAPALLVAGLAAAHTIPAQSAAAPAPSRLTWKMAWIWTLGRMPAAEVVRTAKAMGFNAIQARNREMVDECHHAGIAALAALWFGTAPEASAQVILPEEEERFRAQAARPKAESTFQEGGEPVDPGEVSDLKPWCFDRPEAIEFGKREIDRFLADGYDGIAFDAIGYRNYYACFCPASRARHEEYRKAHPGLPAEQAVRDYSRQCLVEFYAALAAYARAKVPRVALTCHVYPYFAPEPLYGNRLDLDTCGQTVSWFFLPHWPLEKVERYARALVEGESAYHAGTKAAPFIAVYSLPPQERHRKSAERVRREIRLIKEAGASAIQLAELGHILNDPEVARAVSEELGGTWRAAEAPAATARVDAGAPGVPVSPALYGNNLKAWGGSGELLWDGARGDLNFEAVERLRGLGATVLRFPGGSHAEAYRWREAVGPKRGGTTSRFTFGTDEFLRLCRELGAEPMITVNWSAGPAEAAAWVEYCNGDASTPMGRLRAANGQPEPYRVRTWELGNETYSKVPARVYADSLAAFAHAMKAADPAIRLGGVGWAWPNWRSHYTKDPDPWNETVLARGGASIDALVIHPYCWLDPKPPAERVNSDLARTILAWPGQMAGELAAVRRSAAKAGYPDLPFWFTEYNGYYGEQGMCAPLCQTVNGVLNAAMLNEFLRLGVPVANHWEMASSGWSHFAALAHPRPDLWLERPAWHVLSLYSRHCRGSLVPATVEAPAFDHAGYSIVRAGKGTPAIDAVAVRRQDGLTVALVNKDPDRPAATLLEITGIEGVKAVERHTFAGDGPFSTRCDVRSEALPIALPLSLNLPACSVTLVVLSTAR